MTSAVGRSRVWAVGAESLRVGAVEDLHGVEDREVSAAPGPQVRAIWGDAADVAAAIRLGAGASRLAALRAPSSAADLGLLEVVDAGRAAAELPLGRLEQLEARDRRQQLARLRRGRPGRGRGGRRRGRRRAASASGAWRGSPRPSSCRNAAMSMTRARAARGRVPCSGSPGTARRSPSSPIRSRRRW